MDAHLSPIITLAKNGDRQTALIQLKDHLQANPKDIEGWWLMANLVKNSTLQRQALDRVLKLDPQHAQGLALKARLENGVVNSTSASSSPFAIPVENTTTTAASPFSVPLSNDPPPRPAPKPLPKRPAFDEAPSVDDFFDDDADNPFVARQAKLSLDKPVTLDTSRPMAWELKKQFKEMPIEAKAKQTGGLDDTTVNIIMGVVIAIALIIGGYLVYSYMNPASDELELSATASNSRFSIDHPDDWKVSKYDNDRIVITSRDLATRQLDPWAFMSDGYNGMYPALAFVEFVMVPIESSGNEAFQAVIIQPVPQTPQYLIDIMIQQITEIYQDPTLASDVDVTIESTKEGMVIDGSNAEFTVMSTIFKGNNVISQSAEAHVVLYFAVVLHEGHHYPYTVLAFDEKPIDWEANAKLIAESIDFTDAS